MLKDPISKTSGWQFHKWLLGPEKFSGLSRNGPKVCIRDNCLNRPFPSSCLPSLQSESKCEVFVMIISSTLHMNEN